MKIKDFIYKYSIRLFILIVAYLIVSFPFQYTQEKMNDVSQPVRWLGTLLFFIIACFIVRYRKKLEAVFVKKSLFFIILPRSCTCQSLLAAPSFSCTQSRATCSAGLPHRNISTAAKRCSGQVWMLICDSASNTTPVTPCSAPK